MKPFFKSFSANGLNLARTEPDSSRAERAVLEKNYSILCLAGGICGLMAFGLGIVLGVPVTTTLLVGMGLTSLILFFPLLLKTNMHLMTLSVISMLCMVMIVFVMAFNFGGFMSPVMPWLGAVPILAYYYLRRSERLIVLGTLALGLIVMAAIQFSGRHLPLNIPESLYPPIYLTSTLFALAFICVISHVFVTLSRQSKRKLVAAKYAAIEKQRQAEWANAAKTQFLANMSHELRTPLNAIIGFSDLVRNQTMGPLGNAKYLEYSDDIHESAKHLLELIDDILNCSRLESGAIKISASLVDVADLVDQVVKQVMFRPEAGTLVIEKKIDNHLPLLSADARLMKQVVINLLVNALKFTREGGKITIEATIDETGRFQFLIADTGVGIPPHDLGEITSPFTKSKHSQTVTAEGAGLGLSIATELIELHHGTLEIQSEVNVGTTVTCSFPAWRTFVRPHVSEAENLLRLKEPPGDKVAA